MKNMPCIPVSCMPKCTVYRNNKASLSILYINIVAIYV